MDIAVVLT